MILDLIKEYKILTKRAIEELERDGFEKLELFLEKREDVLKKIDKAEFDKEEFKRITIEKGVLELDKLLLKSIKISRDNAKKNLADIIKHRQISSQYNNAVNKMSFVNIKI